MVSNLTPEEDLRIRRDIASGFLGIEPFICGVAVRPLTPRLALRLEVLGNHFITDGRESATASDAIQFLEIVARDFDSRKSPDVRPTPDDILAYLDRTHRFLPPHHKGFDALMHVGVVGTLVERFGWTVDQAMDTPFRQIWILLRKPATQS